MELRERLHKMIDRVENDELLQSIYQVLLVSKSDVSGKLWQSLTQEQRDEVLLSLIESDDDANLVDWETVKGKLHAGDYFKKG